MNYYRYKLEKYKGTKSRYCCPGCQSKNKTFSRYIDQESGEYITPDVGRCDRENSCGYHYTPKQFFKDNNISSNLKIDQKKPKIIKTIELPVSYIPISSLKDSLCNYKENYFIQFLVTLFGNEITNDLISKYLIGTSSYWQGSTVFWQIDILGKARTGKIMLYDSISGKRIKEPYNHINWVHKSLNEPNFLLKQCLFGEHLLKDESITIAIVESEKTAVIASVYFPELIWVAVGSLNNLTIEKCKVLKGRNVILFPDLNGLKKWNTKAIELNKIANVYVSDIIERIAIEEEKLQGLDIVDYLLRKRDKSRFALNEFGYPIFWDYNIKVPDTSSSKKIYTNDKIDNMFNESPKILVKSGQI